MSLTLDNIMLDLSYLLGETSIPSPAPADRQAFIQRTLDRCYRSFNFEMNKSTTTLSVASGNASLPTDAQVNPALEVRVISGTVGQSIGDDLIFQKIPYEQQDSYGNGDYRYWVTGTPGAYILHTSENGNSSVSRLTVQYETVAPTINASISTPFPSSMCLARGALVYLRQAEDPQSDISQLEALFQRELEEIISTQIRNQPDKPAVTRHQMMGSYTGDIEIRNFPPAV